MRMRIVLPFLLVAFAIGCGKTEDKTSAVDMSSEPKPAEANLPAAPQEPTAKSEEVAKPRVEPSEPSPSCEHALPAAAIGEICGKEFSLRPSIMEGKSKNTCSRTGSGLFFIVSEHQDAAMATRAAGVAQQDDPLYRISSKASGRYLIEVKSTKDGACGSVEKLSKLVTKAASVIQ